ncbi:peptidase associated/transthyretin-like domain-containing protein [Gelidibacter pelagius]|uniref:Carboxypeptidase-like regulatory domain-containing protein n=1 Tax=Gelidibacter pelagius TaxID=2819985 RepID=A0ABS3SS78_9FLAO|nr:carboxypeptidase-like regulatory domain-containing protein [Gelidibacter pelagius]MBO3098570.1 carboxypeptidase-like regulatory domain-containing protein [Gelidibacter pelagius]
MTKITILFCLWSTMMLSQNITGTLYDAEAPISGAKIMNITSKSITSTDGNGNFKIYAQINDTLIFSSLFHHTNQLMVTESHLMDTPVFELRKMVNELDEVEIQGAITSKEMNEETASKTLNQQFQNDIKKHGYKYKKPNTGPLDLMAIGESIIKLFKRKTPREFETVETTITSDDFDTLFKSDKFFNDQFLVLNLNITKDYKHLYFAYCESKEMSSSLLQSKNRIYLVDKFLEYSEEFREILKESQKQ